MNGDGMPDTLKQRLLVGGLVTWFVAVNVVYYWNLFSEYGSSVLKIVSGLVR